MSQELGASRIPPRFRLLGITTILAASLLWASWPALRAMAGRWLVDPRYSHGFVVVPFAAFLLWHRRDLLAKGAAGPSWWGVPLIAAGEALRLAGARYYVAWFEAMSLLPSLAGLGLLVGGWRALRWSLPSILFLFFMLPLPYRAEMALGSPLQRIATLSSNYALQTIGFPAVAEGNVILLEDARIGVVEACNGLGMLFTFFAYAVATALVIRRPAVDKALIILSAVPIALAANITRIVVTGVLHETAGGRVADAVYHDLAGWLMMPLALGVLWAELSLLSRLLVEIEADGPIPVGFLPVGDAAPPRDRRVGGRPRPASPRDRE
jgi:exosortase